VVLRYRWTVDGEPRNLPLGTARLPAATLRKGQRVAVEVRAFDGELEGPPARAEAVAVNTPPGAPAVEIRPAAPRRGDALRAVLTAAAPDADGDALTYRWTWKKNGQPYATRGDPREVPGRDVARGDRLEVEVWAADGEADGPHVTAAVVVGATPPSAPRIALDPPWPAGGARMQAKVLEESADADGDPIRYDWRWTVDGKPVAGASGPGLPPEAARKHARVRVTVTPYGGVSPGAPVTAEVTVANAPPGAPEVALSPARPAVGAPLAATLSRAATDPDGDPITYRYRWLRDGFAVPVPDATAESRREPYWTSASALPAEALARGQRWTVEVQAFDGEAYGPVARATATVVNSPPPPPRVAFVAAAPRRGDGLRLAVTQPPDPDGDLVTWRYTWWRDGKKQDLPREQAEIPRGSARRGERWRVEVVAGDGEDEAPPVAAEVVVANTPPGAPALALCDRPVADGTPLEVTLREPARDADGDALTYRYAWTVDGKPAPGGHGHAKLSGASLRKHDVVRVVVAAFDGVDVGPEAAAECGVENTPPTRPEIALEPREPMAGTGLKVAIRTPASDRDGDPVSYHYAWWRDGVLTDVTAAQLPPGAIRHGERWQVAVRAFDGEEEGEPAVASAAVGNTVPPAPAVMIVPEAPATGQALSCRAAAPPVDADGELLELRYRWFRDGEPMALGEGRPEIPAGVVRRKEAWRCEAWASDGTVEGPRARAEVKVRNSAPGAPQVAIEPEAPRRGDALACRIATEAEDPDGDRVAYRYAWTVDGAPAPAGPDPARVAPEKVRKGQRWRCLVTASDGELAAPAAAAERVIGNSPPGPARVRVAPAAPGTGEPLRCEIAQKSEDPDGDPVRYTYAWFRNGEVQPFAATTDQVPVRLLRGGDRWRCVATPSDGELSGPPSGSAEVSLRAGGDEPLSRSTP
ncbi:MAG TPA: hypothetical protein VFP65_29420, partial [Anaeromyxobacteraceae bacterium]|nr:hypothetical protein [Anaeromyxobacteraceae bacterium]